MGSRWSGQYGGINYAGGTLERQGSHGYYWSQMEYDATLGHVLLLTTSNYVYPQHTLGKYDGATLRCVK